LFRWVYSNRKFVCWANHISKLREVLAFHVVGLCSLCPSLPWKWDNLWSRNSKDVINDVDRLFAFGPTAPPPPSQLARASFTRFPDHTQRPTTVGRTPLDEWSARREDLYLTTYRHPWSRCDSNPQSQQASGLRPRGHWERRYKHTARMYLLMFRNNTSKY
jgi:hypothetical protein